MPKRCISELLSCCDTNPASRNAACMLQQSEFPSELPESWEEFNAGLQSEKLRQKESVNRRRGCRLFGRWGDTSSAKSSSLSLSPLHISRTENPLWCLIYHGNFRHPPAPVGTIFPNFGSGLPAASISPQASHLQSHQAVPTAQGPMLSPGQDTQTLPPTSTGLSHLGPPSP